MKKIITIISITLALTSFIAHAQLGEWTWMHGTTASNSLGIFGTQTVVSPTNNPPGLYEACQWTDPQGNFWVFGGGNNGPGQYYADLWKFNPATNEWIWMKGPGNFNLAGNYGTINVPSPTNNPGCRGYGEMSWVDNNNNLWLYGGYGYDADSVQGLLGDLWMYDISTNMWTWKNGSKLQAPMPVYGTKGVAAPGNTPGGRSESNATWVDANNNLWLYGGSIMTGLAGGDMWKYDITANEWTWMSGTIAPDLAPVYGTKLVPDTANNPGARWCYSVWNSTDGNFWMYGGYGYSDVWRYDVSTNLWTWMSGAAGSNSTGHAGTICLSDTSNFPSGRTEDRSNWNLGCDNFVKYGSRDDMWIFNSTTLKWTWIKGNANADALPNWGTILVSSTANNPGSRQGALGFKDNTGNLWLFGGAGAYNDMWKFVVDTTCPSLPRCVETTSIPENYQTSLSITLYPNPTFGTFTLSYNSQLSPARAGLNSQLVIMDVLGQEVYTQAITNPNQTTINVSQLSNGVYFYQLTNGMETYRGKFVKE